MDSNHDKQYQKLLCYRYTIAQTMIKRRSAKDQSKTEIRTGIQSCAGSFSNSHTARSLSGAIGEPRAFRQRPFVNPFTSLVHRASDGNRGKNVNPGPVPV